MNKLPIAFAAAALATGIATTAEAGFRVPSIGSASLATKVYCDEYCEEYVEAVREAREEAAEEAAARAEEAEEYGYERPRSRRQMRRAAPSQRKARGAVAADKPRPSQREVPVADSGEPSEPAAVKSSGVEHSRRMQAVLRCHRHGRLGALRLGHRPGCRGLAPSQFLEPA
jgi:hypothetical protein